MLNGPTRSSRRDRVRLLAGFRLRREEDRPVAPQDHRRTGPEVLGQGGEILVGGAERRNRNDRLNEMGRYSDLGIPEVRAIRHRRRAAAHFLAHSP
jgi:hypothetical protein